MMSFWLVVHLSPITYSVGNSAKRLVTILASIIYFSNPVSPLNVLSSMIAILGVMLYRYPSRVVVTLTRAVMNK
jgi:solute carrier family 35 protein E1